MPKPVSPTGTVEVVASPEHDRRLRRRFSAEDKRRLLQEAEACPERGQLAALLRRERLYSSQLATWRTQLEREKVRPAWKLSRPVAPPSGMPRTGASRRWSVRRCSWSTGC
jgi:transposase-like protein